MKRTLLTISIFLGASFISFGQFYTKPGFFTPTGLSNSGLAVGYEMQAGPYEIWNADSNTTITIGGLAPGQGIGSQARFSDIGNYICGTSPGTLGAEMSRYNDVTQQWTTVGSNGFPIDSTVSGGFGISGDGNTVVGLTWADTAGGAGYAHAAAWNPIEGFMDLGSLFDSMHASTRANAVSYDGNIVVGWQDFNGPWKSAVWRKNPNGGYYPNQYLLIDTAGSASDEYNQLGECSVISSDGNWIGGYGDYANNGEPWLWSQATGVVNLGTMPNVGQGYVSGINADGSVAVGWFDGALWGDPQTPFIWTSTGGLENLVDYVHNTLGLSTGSSVISGASCLSANGEYIAGWGYDTASFDFLAFRVNTFPLSVNELNRLSEIKVFPNPFATQTTIQFASDEWHAVKISDVVGNEIISIEFTGREFILDRGTMKAGIYFLQAGDKNQNFPFRKIIIQ